MPWNFTTKGMISIAVGILGAAGFIAYGLHHLRYVVTDNAILDAPTVPVSARTDGYVMRVLVDDNQQVSDGQALVQLDDATARARLAEAMLNASAKGAAVRNIDDRISLSAATIRLRVAAIDGASSGARLSAAELARARALAAGGWISEQGIQRASSEDLQASAAVRQADATLEAERRSGRSLLSARAMAAAEAAAAEAVAEQARIELAHLTIRSSIPGVVAARSVRVGQYVRQGAPLLFLVPVRDVYVVANFKETQLARLRVGQPAEIRVDASPSLRLTGHIESFAPATGAKFALIPVENAVGNFTKITQRVPVKILLDSPHSLNSTLRPGLSVKVKVDVEAHEPVSRMSVNPTPPDRS